MYRVVDEKLWKREFSVLPVSQLETVKISFVVFQQIYLTVTKELGTGFIAVALAYPVGWTLCSTLLLIRYSKSVLVRKSRETVR